MRIDGPAARQALIAAAAARAAATAAPAFAPEGNAAKAASPPAAPVMAATPATSMAMLVALASLDPAVERRRRQAVDADRGLRLLERLRDQLSAGMATPDQLRDMRAWVDQHTTPDDPALAEILRDIDLRVRVELAKHDLTA